MKIQKKSLEKLLTLKHAAPLYTVWDKDSTVAPQTILITEKLLKKFDDSIEDSSLVAAAIADTEDAVNKEFTTTALNAINSLYYGYCHDAFTKHGDIANIYVKNRMVQYSLLQLFLEKIKIDPIRIKEFCCGSKYARWQQFAKYMPINRSMDVTLCDITSDIIPIDEIRSKNIFNMKFDSCSYDLRESFPVLPEAHRFDALLVTYGFDSVWLEDDVMYVKQNGVWSEILYRVKVLPGIHDEEHVLALLRKETSDVSVPLSLFNNVVVERIAKPVDMKKVKYGADIEALYGDYDEVRVIVPSTMVTRVEEAFAGQLKDSGVFVIGEVATYPIKAGEKIEMTIADFNTTGKVGKYKVEDFWLAERILTQRGFKVEVIALDALGKRYGKEISEDTEDTWLMVVSK